MTEKQLNIRIPADLIEQVRATAKRDKRSLAKQVEYILQNYLTTTGGKENELNNQNAL